MWRGWLGAILLVVGLVFSVSARDQSHSFQTCVSQQQGNDTADKQMKDSTSVGVSFLQRQPIEMNCTGLFLNNNSPAINTMATIVIAIFTVVLAFVTGGQVRLTREVLVHDKRAFVFPVGFKQFYENRPGKPNEHSWRFRPTWKNSGDTPTKDLEILSICDLRNSELPADFDFNKLSGSTGGGFIGPQIELQAGLCPLPPLAPITPDDIVAIQKNEKYLYLMGWSIYTDVLDSRKKYTTRFCWRILVTGDPVAFVPNDSEHFLRFDWSMHRQGNYTN